MLLFLLCIYCKNNGIIKKIKFWKESFNFYSIQCFKFSNYLKQSLHAPVHLGHNLLHLSFAANINAAILQHIQHLNNAVGTFLGRLFDHFANGMHPITAQMIHGYMFTQIDHFLGGGQSGTDTNEINTRNGKVVSILKASKHFNI